LFPHKHLHLDKGFNQFLDLQAPLFSIFRKKKIYLGETTKVDGNKNKKGSKTMGSNFEEWK